MELLDARKQGQIGGNTGTGWLKLIALAFMLTDHMGKMLFPTVPEMRILGRIAFPLYAWSMVVGFHYTRDPLKYMLRVLVVGLISQPLYMRALNHTWSQPNIFLTLLLALAGLCLLVEKPFERTRWGLLAGRALAVLGCGGILVLAQALGCDYGWRGVLLTWMLWAVRDKRSGIAAVMAAFCLFWGSNSGAITSLFGLNLQLSGTASALLSPWLKVQAMAILALPLMLLPMKRPLHLPSWVGYALYPAHLLLLMVLEAAA